MAFRTSDRIHQRGKIPFLVGGTGLYISAVVDNFQLPKGAPDARLRQELETEKLQTLAKKLQSLDPITTSVIDLRNKRRVLRALEFAMTHQGNFAAAQKKGPPRYDCLIIGIKTDKKNLAQKISRRVHKQIAAGLESEVRKLTARYGWSPPSLQSIAYQEWKPYFEQQATRKQIVEQIIIHNRQYAKRQMTWFGGMARDHKIFWVEKYTGAEEKISKFLKQYPSRNPGF